MLNDSEMPIRLLKWLCTMARATVLQPLVRVVIFLLRVAGRLGVSKLARSCFKSWAPYFSTWRNESSTIFAATASLAPPSSPTTYSSTSLVSTHQLQALGQPHAHSQSQSLMPSAAVTGTSGPSGCSTACSGTPLNPIPVAPEQIPRHERRQPIERRHNKTNIKAGQIDYVDKAPAGWERVVHSEGACYFFNATKQVFTDIDLTRSGTLAKIEEYINHLRDRECRVLQIPPLARTQLVIHLNVQGQWCYYFVNHDSRVLFWVDDFDATALLDGLRGVVANGHIRYAIEVQYWLHCEQFPNCIPLSKAHVKEVWGIVAHACADRMTSESSLSTFDEDQLGKILSLVPYLQASVDTVDDYALWVVARVMGNFAGVKFYNFYGQLGARLDADQSVYVKDELKNIWVDNTINYVRWRSFASRLNTEWNGFTIYSTVMLAVDVSFLAVPDVGLQPAATVATYVSLLSVVGSLLSSLLLARQSSSQEDSAFGAAMFMDRMTCLGVRCKALGVMFSLPFALLIWAMIFFLVAFLHVIFQSANAAILGVMIPGAVLLAILTLLPVWWGHTWWRQIF
ncbi:hypothetical protein BDN67DRAFT_825796 [Paxillus ammoniavirescens]|nr:hypothetical protein BDN67DRAFT_825796 [Paxillus ammoniavirescens]